MLLTLMSVFVPTLLVLLNMKDWVFSIYRDLASMVRLVGKNIREEIDFRKPDIYNVNGTNPVILIHGATGNQTEWWDAKENIEKYLYDRVVYAYSLDLDPSDDKTYNVVTIKDKSDENNWTIEKYASVLDGIVTQTLKKHNCDKVTLVGHSMGGIVCAYYENLHPTKIHKVVAVASPFHGAPILSYFPFTYLFTGKRYQQMLTNSEFLSELKKSIEPRILKYLTFGCTTDTHVSNEAAKFGIIHFKLSGYGHRSIIHAEEVWQAIAKFIVGSS